MSKNTLWTVILVLLLVVGGWYLWNKNQESMAAKEEIIKEEEMVKEPTDATSPTIEVMETPAVTP